MTAEEIETNRILRTTWADRNLRLRLLARNVTREDLEKIMNADQAKALQVFSTRSQFEIDYEDKEPGSYLVAVISPAVHE